MKQPPSIRLRLLALLWCFAAMVCASAQVSVTGTVSDNTGETLPGASVRLKGSKTVATTTDIDGNFTISVPNTNATLLVSFIGYKEQQVDLNGRKNVAVVLSEDTEALDEVVVVGYGAQKKVTMTGSVSAITGKELVKTPMQNVSNLLTGKVSGITAVQKSGRPGSDGASIKVRGVNDFSSSGPMVIVDGVPGGMDNLNPNDIESISILKDASAAIYGVQGANGVILITTKKGGQGNARISYGGTFSWVHNTAMPKMLDAKEYMYWHNKAAIMDGISPLYTADIQRRVLADDPDDFYGQTDWQDKVWRTGFTQQHDISAQGGSEKMSYYVSFGMMDQKGTMRETNFTRYNFRSNLDFTVAKNMRFVSNISGVRTEKRYPGVGTDDQYGYSPAVLANFQLPIYKSKYKGYWFSGSHSNSEAMLYSTGFQNSDFNQLHVNLQLEYDFKDIHPWLQGLKASVWGSFRFGQSSYRNFQDYFETYTVPYNIENDTEPAFGIASGFTVDRSLSKGTSWDRQWIFRPQVNYNRKFGKADVGALYLYEATKYMSEGLGLGLTKFATNDPVDVGFAAEIVANSQTGSHQTTSVVSHVGRLNFAWDEKYLFEFAFRYDGSYKFAPENRWGFFPSASAGWVLSSEPFIKENISWIDYLKLRASYGEAGKDNISPFLYNALFTPVKNGTIMNGQPVTLYYTNSYLARNLKWSTTRTYNIGLDFDVLKRKLGAEIDVFYQHTGDMLENISAGYPNSLGGNNPSLENSGVMENRGIDFTLKHELAVNRDFSYRLRGTFSFARNKVISKKNSDDHPSWRGNLGKPLYARYGLIATGLAQTQEQIDNAPVQPSGQLRLGDILYWDTNGDGKIMYKGTESDYVKIGYGEFPEISFSLNMDFNYRNFYLNMLWQGVTHCDYSLLGAYNNGHTDSTPYTRPFYSNGNAPKYLVEEAWTPENTNARYPRLSTIVNGNNSVASTWWMVNGEYVRLKNLVVGYEVPDKVLNKTPFSRLNVYVSGSNVFTFSHFKYVDPESPSVSMGYYPQQATWSLGVNVGF